MADVTLSAQLLARKVRELGAEKALLEATNEQLAFEIDKRDARIQELEAKQVADEITAEGGKKK